MDILTSSVIVAGTIITLGTMVQAYAQGRAVSSALEGIARQPEAADAIGTNLIIGLAFIESLSIYVLVISLILIFADPYTKDIKAINAERAKVELMELQLRQYELQKKLEQIAPTSAVSHVGD